MLKLRWPARCSVCGCPLGAGTRAAWDTEARLVTCTRCLEQLRGGASRDASDPIPATLDRGRPGASAGREHRRRRSNREARVRRRHPHIGGLLLALGASPQHERAFARGQLGEETVARSLERRLADGPTALLHDRRMPGGYGNIDHLAVAPRGVYVIDAKAIKGKVRVRGGAPGSSRLQVNGRTRNKLVLGLARQVEAVRSELDADGHHDVATTGVLCFTEADFPLFARMQIDGFLLRHRRALAKELNASGPLSAQAIGSLARSLGERFPPA
jgi:Nuclease-related domain